MMKNIPKNIYFFIVIMIIGSIYNSSAAGLNFANINFEIPEGKPSFVTIFNYKDKSSDTQDLSHAPCKNALVFHYTNGVFKIVTDGQNSYGMYLIEGNPRNSTFKAIYMPIASSEWNNNTAYITLEYSNNTKTFNQSIMLPNNKLIYESGTYQIQKNNYENPNEIKWSTVKHIYFKSSVDCKM